MQQVNNKENYSKQMCNKNNIISGEKATSEQQVLTQEIDTSQIVVRLSCTFKVI